MTLTLIARFAPSLRRRRLTTLPNLITRLAPSLRRRRLTTVPITTRRRRRLLNTTPSPSLTHLSTTLTRPPSRHHHLKAPLLHTLLHTTPVPPQCRAQYPVMHRATNTTPGCKTTQDHKILTLNTTLTRVLRLLSSHMQIKLVRITAYMLSGMLAGSLMRPHSFFGRISPQSAAIRWQWRRI